MLKRIASAALLLLFVIGPAWPKEPIFDAALEFPNYFVEPNAPDAKSLSDTKREIEKAVLNTFNRISVPVYDAKTKGLRQARMIPYLRATLMKSHPGIEIKIPGREFRSIYAYIYREIFSGARKVPPVSPAETLKVLQKTKKNLPALQVFGKGGRIDLLVDGASAAEREEAIGKLHRILDQLDAAKANVPNFGNVDTRLGTAIGKIESYDSHLETLTRQGGNSIDRLAFGTKSGSVQVPVKDPSAFDDLVRGGLTVHPSAAGPLGDVALVKSIEPLTEIPYLKLSENSDSLLAAEIKRKVASVRTGKFDPEALEEVRKLVRQSFPGGANNRLLRARAESSEDLFRKLSQGLGTDGNYALIPRFAPFHGLGSRAKSVPSHLLVPVSEFIAKHTDGGVVYHGSNALEDAVSMLQQGPFLAEEVPGRGDITSGASLFSKRAEGSGVYSTPDRSFATPFAKVEAERAGVVVPWMLDDNPNIKIIDWEKARFDTWIEELGKQVGLKDFDLFPILASEYDVDLIFNEHPLIQNASILRPAADLEAVKALRIAALKPGIGEVEFSERVSHFSRIQKLYSGLYGEIPELPSSLAPRLLELLSRESFKAPYGVFGDFISLLDSWGYEEQILRAMRANPKIAFRVAYASLESAKWIRILQADPQLKRVLQMAALFRKQPQQGLKFLFDQKQYSFLEELVTLTGRKSLPREFDTWQGMVAELSKRGPTKENVDLITSLVRTQDPAVQHQLFEQVIEKGDPALFRKPIRELLLMPDNQLNSTLLRSVFSRPESAPLKEEIKLLLKKDKYLPLRDLLENCFSKPHSAGWSEAFTYLVETRVDNYEPARAIMEIAKQPHSVNFTEGFATFLKSFAESGQHFYGVGKQALYSALETQPHWNTPTGRKLLETRNLTPEKVISEMNRLVKVPGNGCVVNGLMRGMQGR